MPEAEATKENFELWGRAVAAEMKVAVADSVKAAMKEHFEQHHAPLMAKVSKLKNKQMWRDGALVGSMLASGKVGWEALHKYLLGN